jgi:hypothetical protein
MAGREGGGARLIVTSGSLPVKAPPSAMVASANSDMGGKVGSGARVGAGVKVGHGVRVGLGVGDGTGGGISANALAASRRATRSHRMTEPIRLKATKVALKPWPILFPLFRRVFEFLVVVIFVFVVVSVVIIVVIVVIIVIVVFIMPAAAIVTPAGSCRLAQGNLVVGGLQFADDLFQLGSQLSLFIRQLGYLGLHLGLKRGIGSRDGLLKFGCVGLDGFQLRLRLAEGLLLSSQLLLLLLELGLVGSVQPLQRLLGLAQLGLVSSISFLKRRFEFSQLRLKVGRLGR